MSFDTAIRKLTQDELNFILKNGKRNSVLLDYDFKDLTLSSFKFVKETIPEAFKTGAFEWMLLEAFKDRGINLFHHDISRISYTDVLGFICWIQDELVAIARLETEYLSGDPDIDLTAAGIHNLNQFGILNVIDSLAGGDILKWEEVVKLPYSMIFDKQHKGVVEQRIQKALAAIKQQQNKTKK